MTTIDDFLAGATVDDAVFELAPDYRVLLLAIEGITPQPSDEASEALLVSAEREAARLLAERSVQDLPHVAAWREAYRAFGAKPQRTRNSLEALLRRAKSGLPRVNRLTDTYNALSILRLVPLGGEDLDKYEGSPRLIRADGTENFDTVANGEDVIEHPEPGEVVWTDGGGVTCRMWNWRQGRRTRLEETTTRALFIFDALAPIPDDELRRAADELAARLAEGQDAELRTATRVIAPPR
ncbi:MAG: phenylalanine--tRNA ligase beta subunit-related protein [Actinomycetaceae bacterium]|nr:phenylalanine--tRNA ligase beta subunit-related protein [Actinomycetaceae bacterium]